MTVNSYPLHEVVQGLDVEIRGDKQVSLHSVATLKLAQPGQISFLTNAMYRRDLSETSASVVILREPDAVLCSRTAVVCNNPHYIYAKVTQFFYRYQFQPKPPGIHPTAVVADNAVIPASCRIEAGAVIESGVVLGENVVIGAHCFVGENVHLDSDSILHPHVTLYHGVRIGKRAHIDSGAVIGSDGFGFAVEKKAWHRVVQFGSVVIGDDVDVGAGTLIDRGTIEDTRIGNGVKLDNQVQVAHNVQIGDDTIVAGCAAISGSTIIGKQCIIGGAAKFAGHLTICDGVMVNGGSIISSSINKPGVYASGLMGVMENREWRKVCARLNRISDLVDRIKQLEKKVLNLQPESSEESNHE